METKVKNAFDRVSVKAKVVGVSKVQQQFRKEADINNILAKYEKTGFLVDPSVIRAGQPLFGDFSNMPTYQEAVERINSVNTQFLRLNPDVRSKFNNDPAEMLEFISEPENYAEAVKMGILHKDVLKVKEITEPKGEVGDLKVAKAEGETLPAK